MQHPIAAKRLFLLDMDGTLYLGERLFDGTLDFLRQVKRLGARAIFVTNNSSKSVEDYVKKLTRVICFFTTGQRKFMYLAHIRFAMSCVQTALR